MILTHSNGHYLELSLEEAFAMQEALATAIKRVTTTTTGCALRGARVKYHQAYEKVGAMTHELDGKHYPSSLGVCVRVGTVPQ